MHSTDQKFNAIFHGFWKKYWVDRGKAQKLQKIGDFPRSTLKKFEKFQQIVKAQNRKKNQQNAGDFLKILAEFLADFL